MNKKLILASMAIPSVILGLEATDILDSTEVQASEIVEFKDKDLQAIINIRAFGIEGSEAWKTPITIEQMKKVTTLHLTDFNISSLEGLEHAVNLNYLYITGNTVGDLTPIKNLIKLEKLSITGTFMSDFDKSMEIINGLKNLQVLGLSNLDGYIGEVFDVSKLTNLTKVYEFGLHTPQVKQIKGMSVLKGLHTVKISTNIESYDKKVPNYTIRSSKELEDGRVEVVFKSVANNQLQNNYNIFKMYKKIDKTYGNLNFESVSKIGFKKTDSDGFFRYTFDKSLIENGTEAGIYDFRIINNSGSLVQGGNTGFGLYSMTKELSKPIIEFTVSEEHDDEILVEVSDKYTYISKLYIEKGSHSAEYFKDYSSNLTEFTPYEDSFIVEDGLYTVYAEDSNGNFDVVEYTATGLNIEKPILSKNLLDNNTVNINFDNHKEDLDIFVEISEGQFEKLDSNVFNVTENGNYSFKYGKVKNGNMVYSDIETINVSEIDKENLDEISYNLSNTEPTNKSVTVELLSNIPDIKNIYYSLNGEDFNIYTNPFEVSENLIIEAYSEDIFGNISKITNQEISNIDKENMDIVNIIPSSNAPVNKDVIVTLKSEQNKEIYYSLNNGEFVKYENPVVFENNGNIKSYSKDSVGNLSETKEYTVSNIDKIAPETPIINQEVTEITNKPYGLQLVNQEDGVNTLYKFNDNDWVSLDTDVLNISQNGEYSFKYVDQAGNESEVTVLNIDNFDYEAEDFYLTKEEFNTHGDIFVNVEEGFNDKMYMLVDSERVPLENNKIQVYENGVYTFITVDELGNEIVKDIDVNLVNIIPSIDNLDYDTVTNNPSVVIGLVSNIENDKLGNPKDDEYFDYLLNHLAGLGQEELDTFKGQGTNSIDDVYKFATSGVLSSSDQINEGSGGFNSIYRIINTLPSGTGNQSVIDLGNGYLLFIEDCGEDYIGGLTINDILDGNSSPSYTKIINYIEDIPDIDTQERLNDKLNAQIIKLIEDCLDDPSGSSVNIKELAELCGEFGVLDEFGNFGGYASGSGSNSGTGSGTGGDSGIGSGGNFGSGSANYIGGLIGGLTPDNLAVTGGQIIDYLQCGCLYIPDEKLDRLKKEFDDKIVEIFNIELDKAKLNPLEDGGLEPLIEIIKCGCMPKETEDYLNGLLEEYLKELISNTGSLEELDKLEKFITENGIELNEEIEEQRAKIGLVESGGGLDNPEEDTEEPEITENENIETDIIIPSDSNTNTNSNQVTESNNDLPQTGTEQGTNAGILLLVSGLLGGLLIRRKQNKTE